MYTGASAEKNRSMFLELQFREALVRKMLRWLIPDAFRDLKAIRSRRSASGSIIRDSWLVVRHRGRFRNNKITSWSTEQTREESPKIGSWTTDAEVRPRVRRWLGILRLGSCGIKNSKVWRTHEPEKFRITGGDTSLQGWVGFKVQTMFANRVEWPLFRERIRRWRKAGAT